MEATWTEKLTLEEEEFLIAQFVYEVKRRKLEVPAVFAIEMHKPLSGMVETAGIVTTPFLAPFMGLQNVQGYGRLFSSRQSIDKLLIALETPGEPVKPVRPSSMQDGNENEMTKGSDDEVTRDV